MRVCLATRHVNALYLPLALLCLTATPVDTAGCEADDVPICECPPAMTAAEMTAAEFVEMHCSEHGIAPAFYRAAARREFAH